MPCLPPGPRPSCNGPGKCFPLMSKPPASFPQTCHMPVKCSQSPQVPSPRVGQHLPAARQRGGAGSGPWGHGNPGPGARPSQARPATHQPCTRPAGLQPCPGCSFAASVLVPTPRPCPRPRRASVGAQGRGGMKPRESPPQDHLHQAGWGWRGALTAPSQGRDAGARGRDWKTRVLVGSSREPPAGWMGGGGA